MTFCLAQMVKITTCPKKGTVIPKRLDLAMLEHLVSTKLILHNRQTFTATSQMQIQPLT